jgi:hypothetical protein
MFSRTMPAPHRLAIHIAATTPDRATRHRSLVDIAIGAFMAVAAIALFGQFVRWLAG